MENLQQDITAIRNMMEKSSKFLSLSGLSGIMAGIVASIGGSIAYWLLSTQPKLSAAVIPYSQQPLELQQLIVQLSTLAISVLILSIGTAIYFTLRKANGIHKIVWDKNAQNILFSIVVPLFVAGVTILALLLKGYFDLIIPVMLFFYGLGLVHAANFTFRDIAYLGYLELILGAISLFAPQTAIIIWTLGFGVLHIVYGSIMFYKYDK